MARMTAALAWALALLSAFPTAAEARKGLRVDSGQSSWDKGRVEQTQQQKLARESASLKGSLEQDLHNMDKLLEKLGPLSGQGSAPPGLPPDPEGLRRQIAAFTRAIDQETEEVQQQLAPPPPSHSAFALEFLPADSGKARSRLQARLDDLWEDINYSLRDHDLGHGGEP
uniref:Apolipoprotein A5 n=1 Tax=Myotis myotis TaxID=51298 RepID=A0A7J7VFN3_MYOMY|nr:apolipoprotein A5 [Myotis myotis]